MTHLPKQIFFHLSFQVDWIDWAAAVNGQLKVSSFSHAVKRLFSTFVHLEEQLYNSNLVHLGSPYFKALKCMSISVFSPVSDNAVYKQPVHLHQCCQAVYKE